MKEQTGNLSADFLHRKVSTPDLRAGSKKFPKDLAVGIAGLLSAVPVALAIREINDRWAENPEKAVIVSGAVLAIPAILPIGVYLLAKRKQARLAEIGLLGVGTIGVLLAAVYLFRASYFVTFPGDFLIWSESDFVNDILKFRAGYPIFSAEVNNESFTYVPGTQLLTYLLASLAGAPTSIAMFRAIQIFYTFLAAIVAFFCCRRLLEGSLENEQTNANSTLSAFVCVTGLFLIASNNLTNPFVHLLHNDALAQLVTVTAYWLLLEYEATRDRRILWLMAVIPAAAFWVKQSLILWAILYLGYLLVFDRLRSVKKILYFAAAAFGSILFSILIGYALWKDDFVYWAFTVLGAHGVSPLRSFRHLLDVWLYFAVGLLGGAYLLRRTGAFARFFGHWLIWLILIAVETYTSGVAWMLNHIGPGSLIAGIWFFAALAAAWTKITGATIESSKTNDWLQAGVAAAVLCLLFSGLGLFRVPVAPFGSDAGRYFGEIEREFAAQPVEKTLLDVGSWIYFKNGVVMKDRAPSIGERGYSQTGDFSGIHERIGQKYYAKILVRNLHSPDFWYDHELWNRSSGIRKSLLENYTETGRIKAVAGVSENEMPYGFNEISILVPRAE